MTAKEYLLDLGFDDSHLPELFNNEDKSYYQITDLIESYHQTKLKLLGIDSVSIPSPDYEYEILIDDEGSPFEVNSWMPLATDRLKEPSRIDEYIAKGLIRKRQ